MKIVKYEQQIGRYQSFRSKHQRNRTMFQIKELAHKNDFDAQKVKFRSKEKNLLAPQRCSYLSTKIASNFKSQPDLGFFRAKKNNCDIIFGKQGFKEQKKKQQYKPSEIKVPKFIKERQLSKSDQKSQIIPKFFKSQSQSIQKKNTIKQQNKIKVNDKIWLQSLKPDQSFQFQFGQSFVTSRFEKESLHGLRQRQQSLFKKQTPKINGQTKQMSSFKTTRQTIKTISDCQSLKNFFFLNLTQNQQQELNTDFKKLFSSRRLQKEQDLNQVDEELAQEFLRILD